MSIDRQALKIELTTDPATIGYAAVITDHGAVAKLINTTGRVIDRPSLSSGVLVSCLDKVEFTALGAADKNYLNLFVTASDVPMTIDIQSALRTMFPAGSKTRANINQATKQTGSRADELGFGFVTTSDIADALLRT
tara:strand:- start:767 stop:1177 length:411 start_codon:yes stop_codon:yes gene_type:complete